MAYQRLTRVTCCVLLVIALLMPTLGWAAPPAELQFFEERIRPVLVEHCYACHSAQADEVEASLRLDRRDDLLAGGDTGPAITPGKPETSLLLQALRYEDLEMPPEGQLPETTIADFERWIRAGAHLPEGAGPDDLAEPDYDAAREFWAFRPVPNPSIPRVQNPDWATNGIDCFVLRHLERRGLSPTGLATRRQLIRRLCFDLTGLPPTPTEVDAFVNDASPLAYTRLVDRLLSSPHFGPRAAQHWLDVIRYAESEGFEYDRLLVGAWRFRDYVIDSFNADKPYDVFVSEQLAGDELDPIDPTLRVAAGFHRFGAVRRNAGNQKVASSRNEVLTERTDIVGSAFLGLTIGCARCHDHKFDPISQLDYYRLQAFFAATHEDDVVVADPEIHARWQAKTDRIQQQIDKLKEQLTQQKGEREKRTRQRIGELEAQLPTPLPTLCSIRNDSEQITPIHLLRRGNADLPLQRVGMRPPGVLLFQDSEELSPDVANPRSQLAGWLTDPGHPLTARVIANRIWQQHFGRGLVETANDFGQNGSGPSHPELLDYLASYLVRNDWSTKSLHRLIVTSRTYRQSSSPSSAARAEEIDPANQLLWHFPRRRLSAEEIRDSMLAFADQLNLRHGGESIIVPVETSLIDQLYKPSQWQVTEDLTEHNRRSIYLIAKRNLRLPFMEVFDQPSAQTSCPVREQSTHAPQSLELLNGRLSNEIATLFAARLQRECGDDPAEQVELAYRLASGRQPSDLEQQLAIQFIEEVSLREFALAMFNLNAFLYVK